MGAARFPVRQERDLSGYVPDGHHGGIPTQLIIPPGTSDEDRAAIQQAQVSCFPPLSLLQCGYYRITSNMPLLACLAMCTLQPSHLRFACENVPLPRAPPCPDPPAPPCLVELDSACACLKAELNGPRPGVMSDGSPGDNKSAYSGVTPYTYGGDGHFAAPPQVGRPKAYTLCCLRPEPFALCCSILHILQ